MEENIENRKLMTMYLNEGDVFQPQQAELISFGHVVLTLQSRMQEDVMESSSMEAQ